jgi:hypothetical protein
MNPNDNNQSNVPAQVIDAIRENPLPTMLIGVGLTWIVAREMGRKEASIWSNLPAASDVIEAGQAMISGLRLPENSSKLLEGSEVLATARDLIGQAGSHVQNLGQQAQHIGSDAQGRTEKLGSQLQDAVHGTVGGVVDSAQRIASRVQAAGKN